MPNVNKFYGVGHLGQNPEVRTAQSGTVIATFTVAISTSEKKNGGWVKHTEWCNCVCFGKQAEWLGEAEKGDLCIFSGRLKTESYEKDGQKRYITKIICSDCQTVSKNRSDKQQSGSYGQTEGSAYDPSMNDDIPFN